MSATRKSEPGPPFGLVLLLFLLSGASALVYEVAWLRLLMPVLGADLLAVSAILTAFLGGLAVGSVGFGRVADRSPSPLRLYGLLELGVALYALVLPLLFAGFSRGYVELVQAGLPDGTVTALRFLGSVVLLAVPTVLMGGTLPALARATIAGRARLASRLGTLYAVNTWGAVLGTTAAGFVLLPAFGVRGTTLLAAAVNAVIGVVAMLVGRRIPAPAVEPRPVEPRAVEPRAVEPRAVEPAAGAAFSRLTLLVIAGFALSGFTALVAEVVWTRLVALVLGTTSYAFTSMLATFLFGLALGGLVAARLADRPWPLLALVGVLELAIGLSVALSLRLIEWLPHLHVRLLVESWGGPWFAWAPFASAAAVMLLPTLLFGAVFPFVARLLVRDLACVGRELGVAYAANTFGSISGSLVASFVLVPWLGSERALAGAAGLNLAIGAAFLAAAVLTSAARARAAVAASVALAVAIAGFVALEPGRRLDRSLLGRGVYYEVRRLLGQKGAEASALREAETTIYEKEGIGATVTVGRRANDDIVIRINGKPVASSNYADMRLQRMLGNLPMLLHPDPKDVLVIGLGAGVTFGSAARYGANTTCVELEEAVIGGARLFGPENAEVLDRPNAKVVVADGRNFLLASSERWDVITSDPIHPWVAGAASLYSREHFALAKSRLRPGGVMCQWIPLYELDEDDYRMIVRSFAEVFPHTSLWFANIDSFLIGTTGPLSVELENLARRMAEPEIRADLQAIHIDDPFALLSAFVMSDGAVSRYVAGAPLNTDDRPLLEFTAPLALYEASTVGLHIQEFARNRQRIEPHVVFPPGDDGALRERLRLHERTKAMTLEGRVHNLRGQRVRGYRRFEEAIRLNPDDRDAREYMAGGFSQQGVEKAAAGAHVEAGPLFVQALNLNPMHYESAFNLGYVYFQLQHWPEARQAFEHARRLRPRSSRATASLAAVEQMLGDTDKAVALYREALRIDPASAEAGFNLGVLFETLERWPEAEAEYARLVAAHPEDARGLERLRAVRGRLERPTVLPAAPGRPAPPPAASPGS